MIKYELQRPVQQTVEHWVLAGNDFKTVKSSELQDHLDDGWTLIRKRYFIITSFLDWWDKSSTENKLAFIALVIAAIGLIKAFS